MKRIAILAFTLATVPLLAVAQDQPGAPDSPKSPAKEDAAHEKRDNRPEDDERLARLKREMLELHRAGKHDEAERLSKELHAAWEKQQGRAKDTPKAKFADYPKKSSGSEHHDFERQGDKAAQGPERLRHLHEAIRHLRAAGINEPARDLENAAAKMRESLERQPRDTASEHEHDRDHDRLRRERIGREHEEHASRAAHEAARRAREDGETRRPAEHADAAPLREMHRQLQEMREQMQSMARELQELREQSRRQ